MSDASITFLFHLLQPQRYVESCHRMVRPMSAVQHHISRKSLHRTGRMRVGVSYAGLRFPESYDASVELSTQSDTCLRELLSSPTFQKQVARETGLPEATAVNFTGTIFQPVPWSPNTKLGMPKELEHFHADPDYVFINVPPNFMLNAKIFKPSRLCAVYRKVQ